MQIPPHTHTLKNKKFLGVCEQSLSNYIPDRVYTTKQMEAGLFSKAKTCIYFTVIV